MAYKRLEGSTISREHNGTSQAGVLRADKAFLLYFTTMFIFYTWTYIQLFAQLAIIAYVFFLTLEYGSRVPVRRIKNCGFILAWYGSMTVLFFLSVFLWAYSSYEGSKTMLSVFRICVICIVIFYYVDSKMKAAQVLRSFVLAFFIMSLFVLALTPISSWGQAGEDTFGGIFGHHRNGMGAIAAPLTVLCYFMGKKSYLRYGKLLSAYFLFLTFITGSRSSILQIFIILIIYLLFCQKSLSKWLKGLLTFAAVLILAALVTYTVPYLYETVWIRLVDGVTTVLGTDVVDASALGRETYKKIAFDMFLQRPVLGYGVDGFYCYLRDLHYNVSGWGTLKEVYSHCNYAELAADLGIAGLLVWYVPVITLLWKLFKKRYQSKWLACLFACFASMVIMDYSRIPWETHMTMYLFSTVILMCIYELKENDKPASDVNTATFGRFRGN